MEYPFIPGRTFIAQKNCSAEWPGHPVTLKKCTSHLERFLRVAAEGFMFWWWHLSVAATDLAANKSFLCNWHEGALVPVEPMP